MGEYQDIFDFEELQVVLLCRGNYNDVKNALTNLRTLYEQCTLKLTMII